MHGLVSEEVNVAVAYYATKLSDQGFHVLLAVAAVVDEVQLAVLQDVAFLLDGRDIGRHEVSHHGWLARAFRRSLQHMLESADVCSLATDMVCTAIVVRT